MDMDFLTSNYFYRKACTRRPWQKSMDRQEFGFAPSLLNSMEVAPADELFFNGELLPLQVDQRLHIVQALSCEKAPSSSFYVSQDEEAPNIKDHENPSFDRAPPICHRSDPRPMLSLCCIDEETKEPWLSYWHRDEEIVTNSCRIEGNSGIGNSMMDPQSSSFRSQSSGFWDSGVDKDMGDSSSSSRDSNGSSQDAYLPHSTALEAPACPPATHGFHAKPSFHIPWKSFLKKASNKAAASSSSSSPPLTISRKGYPEDGSEYRDGFPHSLKESSLPWKLEAYAEKSKSNQDEKGKSKGITTSWVRSKYLLCKAAEEDVIAYMGQGGRNDEYEKEELKRKQQRSATNKSSTHNSRKTNIRKETTHSMLPTSMSTMHEVQSALQSAIAHCKESMREA